MNKETLQKHNTRLTKNNNDLNDILEIINNLPIQEEVKLQDKEVTPKKEVQIITSDDDYDGLNQVTVNAVTNEIDSNIVAENIKEGVEILGVTGTLQEGITPTGSLDITENGEYDVSTYEKANVNVEGAGGKYAPRFISFYQYTGTELNDEIANLDTSNVTDMNNMFYYCTNLKTLDLSNFNTSNVTNMNSIFYNCTKLENLNLSSFDTANVTNMSYMFYQNYSIKSLDLRNFNTKKVNTMKSMFWNFNAATSLNLSSFDTSNVTDMSNMFRQCSKLQKLDIRNFTFDKVTIYSNMFGYVPADCEIIVKSDTERNWILTNGRSDLTNVKTVAEYEAS